MELFRIVPAGDAALVVELPERIDIQLNFYKPFPSEALTSWKLTDLGNGDTEVLWQFEQKLAYFQRYFGMMMDGMLGSQFEQGLARLKARMEANPG